ncbi:hypothetical protein V8E53_000085 [Lactarius tabidus]
MSSLLDGSPVSDAFIRIRARRQGEGREIEVGANVHAYRDVWAPSVEQTRGMDITDFSCALSPAVLVTFSCGVCITSEAALMVMYAMHWLRERRYEDPRHSFLATAKVVSRNGVFLYDNYFHRSFFPKYYMPSPTRPLPHFLYPNNGRQSRGSHRPSSVATRSPVDSASIKHSTSVLPRHSHPLLPILIDGQLNAYKWQSDP